jgi:hypothetical protein
MFNSNCASVPLVASVDGGNGNGMFGNDSWIGLIIILALLSGNFGGFGGFGGGNGGVANEVQRGFDNQSVLNKLNGLENGLCDGFYSQNTTMLQGFNGLQQTVANGFHGVDNAICTLGYQNQQGFNTLAHQISDCCCETQRSIDGVNYNMATQACETRHAIQDSTRQILDFLTTDKIATLQAENQNLKLKASQAEQNAYITANQQAQTAELIRRLGADCPVNAYVVQPPTPVTFPTNCCGQFSGYGYNNGCGCA